MSLPPLQRWRWLLHGEHSKLLLFAGVLAPSLLLLPTACSAVPAAMPIDPAVEKEIEAMEPDIAAIVELSVQGSEKGAAYNRTADFCDQSVRAHHSPRSAQPAPPPVGHARPLAASLPFMGSSSQHPP